MGRPLGLSAVALATLLGPVAVSVGASLPGKPLLHRVGANREAQAIPGGDSVDASISRERAEPIVMEVVTTAPPAEEGDGSATSVIQATAKELWDSLVHTPYQWVNAVMAAAFGLVMVFDGEAAFQWIVLATAFLIVGVLAMSEVSHLWALDAHSNVRRVVGLEAGLIGAYACQKGYDGVLICVGALLGMLMGYQVQMSMVKTLHWEFIATEKWCSVVIYSIFVAFLIGMFRKKSHLSVLAWLSPLIGGAFTTSACAFGVTELAVHGHLNWMGSVSERLTPVSGPWIKFLYLLWPTGESEDVGLFASPKYEIMMKDHTVLVDQVTGWSFWMILFIVGTVVQFRRHQREKKSFDASSRGVKQEPAKSGRVAPLLANAAPA